MKTLKLHKNFGSLIMTRQAVIGLFDSLVNINDAIIMDFKNIEFISRSAAHEYLRQKLSCGKEIKETNMSQNVKAMFMLVAKQLKKVIV